MIYPEYYSGRKKFKDHVSSVSIGLIRELGKAYGGASESLYQKEHTVAEMLDFVGSTNAKIEDFINDTKKLKGAEHYLAYQMMTRDGNVMALSAIAERFSKDPEARVYKVSSLFAKALSKIKDEVRHELLPSSFCGYFPIADNTLKDYEGVDILGIYVSLDPCGASEDTSLYYETGIHKGDKNDLATSHTFGKRLRIVTLSKDQHEAAVPMRTQLTIKEGDRLIDVIKKGRVKNRILGVTPDPLIPRPAPEEPTKHEHALYAFVINVISYIHSLQPDVTMFKPVNQRSARESKMMEREFEVTDTMYPTVFVSWSYGKDRIYSVESTWVDSHLRWQRCGSGFRDTKLIMVSEHERHYKNTKKEDK